MSDISWYSHDCAPCADVDVKRYSGIRQAGLQRTILLFDRSDRSCGSDRSVQTRFIVVEGNVRTFSSGLGRSREAGGELR